MDKITVLYGSRQQLSKYIRTLNKQHYDIIHNVHYIPANQTGNSLARGSYDLFRPTSLKFHIIVDYKPEYYDGLMAYLKIDEIILPRAMGAGGAPKCKKRVPIIILVEDPEDFEHKPDPQIKLTPVATLFEV